MISIPPSRPNVSIKKIRLFLNNGHENNLESHLVYRCGEELRLRIQCSREGFPVQGVRSVR